MSKKVYTNNSSQKDFIRSKWIDFAKEIYQGNSEDFGILTFPAQEMQDLHLFNKHGFIQWEEVETESTKGEYNYRVVRGKIRCFEKNGAIQRYLSQKLIAAKVEGDFFPYIAANYSKIISGKDKTFPVDVVNLDFDGRLQPNEKYPFEAAIKYIFEFQSRHKKDFSLFLTWPITEHEDMAEYKDLLKNIIETNLADPSAIKFKDIFESFFESINDLGYEKKSVIGVSKIIFKKASQNLYALKRNEFFVYGGNKLRKRMVSLLFNFSFDGKNGTENIIYHKDVVNSLLTVVDVNELP